MHAALRQQRVLGRGDLEHGGRRLEERPGGRATRIGEPQLRGRPEQAREQRQQQLGREAGLSHPFLSQLERGLARPSVGSIERIARALGVPVGLLWSAPARGGRAVLVRSDAGEHGLHDDASAPGGVRRLTGEPREVREWTGGSRRWPAARHVEQDVAGGDHALEEGDALLFDGGVPHRLRRTGGVSTRALKVASPA